MTTEENSLSKLFLSMESLEWAQVPNNKQAESTVPQLTLSNHLRQRHQCLFINQVQALGCVCVQHSLFPVKSWGAEAKLFNVIPVFTVSVLGSAHVANKTTWTASHYCAWYKGIRSITSRNHKVALLTCIGVPPAGRSGGWFSQSLLIHHRLA